jgi:hypothetical protein
MNDDARQVMAQEADRMRGQLLDVQTMLDPIYEWGEGQKVTLMSRGWSPESAEQIAARLVIEFMATTFRKM